ncbi:MAG: hypothetical protein IT320_13940 [Anaerolineae bacterium]|nr:hypothetical protein [Anaerolineae bacterium]
MKKRLLGAISLLLIGLLTVTPLQAQDSTLVNSVQILYVTCPDAGVLNVSGTVVAGWDIYYQLFSGANGTGDALSTLRQISVNGTYAVSERLPYANGTVLASGTTASVRVLIAREGDSSQVDYQTTVNDNQDGCSNPQNSSVSSTDTGTGATTSGSTSGTVRILAPGSGYVNPNLEAEGDVFVGARPSLSFRSETPGMIFAECDSYELANPGIVYDNDNVVIFWSWFTRTSAQMQQHLDTVQYSVKLNSAPLTDVRRSEPGRRGGANTWVFFSGQVGHLRPGHYEVEYKVTWSEPHFDGYDNYGPGTDFPELTSVCNFDIVPNPDNLSVSYSGQYFPTNYAVHDLLPGQ